MVLILALIEVGPVTVKPLGKDVAPTRPLNVTLPAVAEPVVAVSV